MNYLGVDPGKSGAIVLIDQSGRFVDLIRNSETEADVSNWVADLVGKHQYKLIAALEKVASRPGQGVSSTFKFGQSYGFLRGLLIAHKIRFEAIAPSTWQRELGCQTGGDKNVTKAKAQELFPEARWTHATADAVLLAEYARRCCSI